MDISAPSTKSFSNKMSSNAVGILIIIAIIVIGISTGGAIFKGGGFSGNPVSTSSGIYNGDSSSSGRQTSLSREINKVSRQADDLKITIDKFIENRNASVYKDKVSISTVSRPGNFRSYIRFSATNRIEEPILITGWKLRSAITGAEQIIGGASNLPYPNFQNEEPIYLPARGKVVVTQIPSPINVSFRTNKCTGYFDQNENFVPSLERACPAPSENLPPLSVGFNEECLDFIERLPQCEAPETNDIPDTLSYDCEYYIRNQINYNACVALHKNDRDFYRSEWRVFPKSARNNWLKDRDTIQLIDSVGKIVDTYSY